MRFFIIFILIFVSSKSFSQGKILAKSKTLTIFEYKDSVYYWYYSKSNSAPFNEEVIFRTDIKDKKSEPICVLKDSIFAIITKDKYGFVYFSWVFNPIYKRKTSFWKDEDYNLIISNWQLNWQNYSNASLFTIYRDEMYEDFGFIDVLTPFIIKYNNHKRWLEIFHTYKGAKNICSEFNKDNCIKVDKISMPYINKDPLKELHDKLLKESKEKQKKNSIKN